MTDISAPRLALGMLAAAAILAMTATADANQMTVFSCHDPSGNAVGNEGWVVARTGDDFLTATDTCGNQDQGALSLDVGANSAGYADAARIEWNFQAPAWATIASYSLTVPDSYTSQYSGGGVGQDFIDASDESDPIYDYRNLGGGSFGATTVSRTPPDSVTAIKVNASCDGASGRCPANTHIAHIDVSSATLLLNDSSTPSVSNLAGNLLSGEPLTGTVEVSFEAADNGPGVYAAQLVVDGQAQPEVQLSSNNGHCQNLGQTTNGTRSFSHPEPCAKSASGNLTLDTANLHDGNHTVKLLVEDASGNTTTAFNRTVITRNAPVVTSAPVISGLTQVGDVLSATNGVYSPPAGAGTLSAVAGQWLRCNATGEKCAPISGATSLSYTLSAEDLHRTLVYQNTVSDSDGQTVSDSQPTQEIVEVPGPGGNNGGSSTSTSTTTTNNTTTNSSSTNSSEGLSNEALAIARGAANGSPASDQASLSVHWAASASASSVKVRYPSRSRAEGKLVASDGQPISEAVLQVMATPSSPGASPYLEGTVKTSGDGSFVFDTSAKKPSRTLTFEYKSYANNLSLAAEAKLAVAVPVPISLRVSPRSVHKGTTIRMSGSVPGPIPADGKQIVLQALALGVRGAKWQTFNVVRTNRAGRFKATYRFRFEGPARYRIRAFSRYEQDYPYLANTSPTTLVKEG